MVCPPFVQMQSGHGHSHGLGGGGGDHGHSHGTPKKKKAASPNNHAHAHGSGSADSHAHSHGGASDEYKGLDGTGADGDHGHAHGSGGEHDHDDHIDHPEPENINVKAAFIHIIGDAVQSAGVMLAAAFIWANPSYRLADPLCTFFFSILVLFTTTRLIKQSVAVLMEGVPEGIDPDEVEATLREVPGVLGQSASSDARCRECLSDC